MTKLSRRAFLKHTSLAGAALGMAGPRMAALSDSVAEAHLPLGRAFGLTDVYQRPDLASPSVMQLAPDSVHTLAHDCPDDWYHLNSGFVPRHTLQPIAAYVRPVVDENSRGDFWIELIAPSSAVREWCAAHAPILTRLGYGAVVYVSDVLRVDRDTVWYGLAPDADSPLYGWSNALHFESLALPSVDPPFTDPVIKFDTRHSQLVVYDGLTERYRSRIAAPQLNVAETTLTVVRPGTALAGISPLGVPWLMQLGTGMQVFGAFWHNRFGTRSSESSVQLPTFAARWLYTTLLNNSQASLEVAVC